MSKQPEPKTESAEADDAATRAEEAVAAVTDKLAAVSVAPTNA